MFYFIKVVLSSGGTFWSNWSNTYIWILVAGGGGRYALKAPFFQHVLKSKLLNVPVVVSLRGGSAAGRSDHRLLHPEQTQTTHAHEG